jgi:DNA-binding NarL/FixJ family response regulator
MPPVRVVFADDNYLVREGVAALLADVADVELVAVVADPENLRKAVDEHHPDAVLTDVRMPPTHTKEGIVAARRIRADHPETGVVVLSQFVEEEYAYELLADGVEGVAYLLKERVADIAELTRAVHEVTQGGTLLDPKVVEALLRRSADAAPSPLAALTEREYDVLAKMAAGRNNAAIARELFMSERAVEKHIGAVFQKLDVNDETDVNRRVMAVLAFLQAERPLS